jgi:hypothetical protein
MNATEMFRKTHNDTADSEVYARNRKIILAMSSDELDQEIAIRLFGWQVFPYLNPPQQSGDKWRCDLVPPGEQVHISNIRPVPTYSTTELHIGAVKKAISLCASCGPGYFADELRRILEQEAGIFGQDPKVLSLFAGPDAVARAALLVKCRIDYEHAVQAAAAAARPAPRETDPFKHLSSQDWRAVAEGLQLLRKDPSTACNVDLTNSSLSLLQQMGISTEN